MPECDLQRNDLGESGGFLVTSREGGTSGTNTQGNAQGANTQGATEQGATTQGPAGQGSGSAPALSKDGAKPPATTAAFCVRSITA